MTILDAAGVFTQSDIHLPVEVVLDAPVLSQNLPITFHRASFASDEVPHFASGLPVDRPLRVTFPNDMQLRPGVLIANPLGVCDNLIEACLMTPVPILLGLIGFILDASAAFLIDVQETVLNVFLQVLLIAFRSQYI